MALSDPVDDAVAVTPDDDTDLSPVPTGLYIGGAGNLTIITPAGTTTTFVGCLAGSVLPVRAARVKSTGTTATNIVALNGG
jgi:hypothetical protein